jgi:hypothetical protein
MGADSLEKEEVIRAYGHENILATNRATLEITKEEHLTRKGDCIVAVSADKGLNNLSAEFKEAMRKDGAKLTISIEAGGITDIVNALGNSTLVLNHPTDMVVRRSSFTCTRTLAIHADKAARDLSRELVNKFKNPQQQIRITLTVKT